MAQGNKPTPVRRDRIAGLRTEMPARFPGVCRKCKGTVYRGDRIYYFPKTRAVEHSNCAKERNHTVAPTKPADQIVPLPPIRPPGRKVSPLDTYSLLAKEESRS